MTLIGDLFPSSFLNPDGDGTRNFKVRRWYVPGDAHLIRLGKDPGYPLTASQSHRFIVVLVENGFGFGYPRSTSLFQNGVEHEKHVPTTHAGCKIDKNREDSTPARISTGTYLECSLTELNDSSYSCEEPEDSAAWQELKRVRRSGGTR